MIDPLTGEDDGAPEVKPPRVWQDMPAGWPRKIPYNGTHPNRVLYPDPKDDPAFKHLLRMSKDKTGRRRGTLVFPAGRTPSCWHPDYRPKQAGKIKQVMAEQKERPHNDVSEGGDPEERVESFRALSRAYASLPEKTLVKIITKLAEQAAGGDEKAQSLFVRMESILARNPVSDDSGGTIKPDTVVSAERALADLVAKVDAVYPNDACPWCGQHVETE